MTIISIKTIPRYIQVEFSVAESGHWYRIVESKYNRDLEGFIGILISTGGNKYLVSPDGRLVGNGGLILEKIDKVEIKIC